jgi:hypothetical protein
MTRSWFEWETEGYPWCSPLRHPQSWWGYRHLPNILLVHYAVLLVDFQARHAESPSFSKSTCRTRHGCGSFATGEISRRNLLASWRE